MVENVLERYERGCTSCCRCYLPDKDSETESAVTKCLTGKAGEHSGDRGGQGDQKETCPERREKINSVGQSILLGGREE